MGFALVNSWGQYNTGKAIRQLIVQGLNSLVVAHSCLSGECWSIEGALRREWNHRDGPDIVSRGSLCYNTGQRAVQGARWLIGCKRGWVFGNPAGKRRIE
jgi:hypothetical protein